VDRVVHPYKQIVYEENEVKEPENVGADASVRPARSAACLTRCPVTGQGTASRLPASLQCIQVSFYSVEVTSGSILLPSNYQSFVTSIVQTSEEGKRCKLYLL